MITQMKASNVLGAKTARACDSCLRRRARWFCAADDAFLCHVCDNSVHSANQLASRHERVRLQTASSSKANCSWHSGFTRKARTPRHNKHSSLQQQRPKHEEEEEGVLFSNINSLPVVPELGGEETVLDESDEQLLFRVPVFDPFEAELCNIYSEVGDERLKTALKNDAEDEETCGLDNFSQFLPSDTDLADFAADVTSLLGGKLDEGSGEMKGSEVLFDCKQEDDIDAYLGAKSAMVKVKDEQVEGVSDCHLDSVLDITSDALNWDIDSESPAAAAQQEEEEKVVVPVAANYSGSSKVGTKRKVFLRLNYEDVISAWATQGSPWTIGIPPDFNSDDCWLDFSGWSGGHVECFNGEVGSFKGGVLVLGSKDEGREARVTRYREKRRTRLFAKKIRYQVRKLNAEKRPRMKGRFVKRTSLLGTTAFPNYL